MSSRIADERDARLLRARRLRDAALFYSLADLLDQYGAEAVLTALRDATVAMHAHCRDLPDRQFCGPDPDDAPKCEAMVALQSASLSLANVIGYARAAEELAPVSLADACRVLVDT
jgi:hypothetical protein